ncbi:MAG: hypothetical protein P8Y70_19355 [Candidatus Lokiarchaeota archaeon]
MKSKINEELKGLQNPLQSIGIDWPFFDLDTIYRELVNELSNAALCKYSKLEDNSFLGKEDLFSIDKAVNQCKKVIISRVKDKIRNS